MAIQENAVGVGGFNPSSPQSFFIVSQYRIVTQAGIARVRLKESNRSYIKIRNMEVTNVAQIAFTTFTNDDRNPPSTGFTDINPNEEWYEVGSTNQVWVRPKIDTTNPVTVEVEVALTLPV